MVFFPLGGTGSAKTELLQGLQEIARRIAKENPPHSISMGVSEAMASLDLFPSAYRNAMHSLELWRALHPGQTAYVVCHDDLGLFRILPSPESMEHLKRLCQDLLWPLLAADKNGALVDTLRVYLECERNIRRTARALGIHDNTNKAALQAIGVTKRFGQILASDQVDFELRQGEIHALLGENRAYLPTGLRRDLPPWQPRADPFPA